METTLFLAQIWGPVLVATGLGVFISRDHYASLYQNVQREPLAVLAFGMMAMAAGIAQISVHSLWGTWPETIISLLGWALAMKGAFLALAPHLASTSSDKVGHSSFLPIIGGGLLIIGAYLSIIGFAA